jgi:hypothetical protein
MACSTASSFAAALVLLLSLAPAAMADEHSARDKSLAQSLFDEGRRLMDAGRYDEACPRFADSQRLDPGGGTVLNLALCYESSGKLALAYTTYNDALSLAIAEHRSERETFARDRIAALAPRLPHLTVRAAVVEGIDIRLDGAGLPSSAWGVSMPVDPGRHTLQASAPGREPFEAVVTLAEGEAREVAVDLRQERPASVVTGSAAPQYVPPREVLRRSPAFYVIGGLALVSLATSAVTGEMAWSAHQSVEQKCNLGTGACSDPSGIDDASRARTLAWVSTWTLGGGVLGAILAFSVPLQAHLTVAQVHGGAAMVLQGNWK